MLAEEGVGTVSTRGAEVSFAMDFFNDVSRWSVLTVVDSGALTVEPEAMLLCVRYRFGLQRVLVMVTGILLAFFAFVGVAEKLGLLRTFELGGFGWLWLFGMNYLTAAVRAPFWLRSRLRGLSVA
jgi:hypothetical protein